MAITAQCGSCNKKFKANDQLAGKRVKCPQCGGGIAIPAPQPVESHGSVASLLDEEAVPTKPVAKPKPKPKPAVAKKCPSCSAEITPGAVLCVNCGFDLRTGKPVEIGQAAAAPGDTPDGEKKKRRKKKKRGERSQFAMFLRGCAFSLGFAVFGVVFWTVGAGVTGLGYSGILSWLASLAIGGLAGYGMSVGYDVEDLISGGAAAIIAFLSIIGGRLMVFIAVFVLVEALSGGAATDITELTGEIVSEEIAEGDDQTAIEDDADWDEPESASVSIPPLGVGFIALFFFCMFSFWDVILIPLSCYVAYHVGAGERFD